MVEESYLKEIKTQQRQNKVPNMASLLSNTTMTPLENFAGSERDIRKETNLTNLQMQAQHRLG
jgi:hypothetical protein